MAHIAESAPAGIGRQTLSKVIFRIPHSASEFWPRRLGPKVVTAETVQKNSGHRDKPVRLHLRRYRFHRSSLVVLAALDRSDGIILIVAPVFSHAENLSTGRHGRHGRYPKDKVHLVLNRAQSLSSIRIKDIEQGLQRRVEVEILSNGELVVSSVNRGQPLVLSHPQSPVSKAICQIADLIVRRNRWSRKKKSRNSRRAFLGRYWGRDNRGDRS